MAPCSILFPLPIGRLLLDGLIGRLCEGGIDGITLATMLVDLSIVRQHKQEKDVHNTPLFVMEARGGACHPMGA